MTEEGLDEEGQKLAQAHVWARDGEGPHSVIVPPAAPLAQPQAAPKSFANMSDLHDLVVLAGAAHDPAMRSDQGDDPAKAAAEEADTGIAGRAGVKEEAKPDGDQSARQKSAQEDAGRQAEGEAEADVEEETETDADADLERDEDGEGLQAQAVVGGPPGQDEVAVGYLILPALYFVAYLVNVTLGGYCFSSNKINALCDIVFVWSPALCAAFLLLGSRWLKVAGGVLVLPLAAAAILGGQYYHVYERFLSEDSPYGPLVKTFDANGWHICRYESSWLSGNMPGVTYVRAKDVAPGILYERKMRLGEPP